jgi:hypothetical protein
MPVFNFKRLVLSSLLFTGCASLGPKPSVSLVQEEISSHKNVSNIVITNVTGIDATGNTGKALLASALAAYGKRSRPVAALGPVIQNIPGLPAGFDEVLLSGYQIEFVKAIEAFNKDGKQPVSLKLPASGGLKLTGIKDLASLAKGLGGEVVAISEIATTLKSGDPQKMMAAANKAKNILPLIQIGAGAILAEINADYVLLTHVQGDEQAWEGKKEIQFFASLVNVKTGKMRYFGSIKAVKGAIPVPYMAQLGVMSSSFFDSVGEGDPLPELSAAAESGPTQVGPVANLGK